MKKMKEQISPKKVLLIFTGIFVIAILCAACIPLADAVMTEDGRHAIIEKTENSGSIKYIIFYFLQIVQIVVVFIPGGPIPLIGSMLFGEWMTLILSAAGCLAGTAIVYFIVKSAGMRVVNIFVSEEKLRSYGFMQNTRRMEIIIFLVFLCPGLPKDALTYIAALTPIKPWRLFLITTIGRLPSLAATIWLGGGISDGNITLVIILAAITICAAAVGFIIKRKIECKNNIEQKE